jgi:hypothetical protein
MRGRERPSLNMTAPEFTQLKHIFMTCVNEVTNDDQLGDWLINLGGSLVALGVAETNQEIEAEE